MAILLVKKLYKPGTYRYIPVCTIYTIVYRYIPVHTGTYRYVPKPLISYHWSGFQMGAWIHSVENIGGVAKLNLLKLA